MAPDSQQDDQATKFNNGLAHSDTVGGVNSSGETVDPPTVTANRWVTPNKPTSIHYNRNFPTYAKSGVSTTQDTKIASQQQKYPPQPSYIPPQIHTQTNPSMAYQTASNGKVQAPGPDSMNMTQIHAGSVQLPPAINPSANPPSRRQAIPPIFRTGNKENAVSDTLAPYAGTPVSYSDKASIGMETKTIYRGAAPEKGKTYKNLSVNIPVGYGNQYPESDMNDRIGMKRVDKTDELQINPDLIVETHDMYSNGSMRPVFSDEFLADGGDSKTTAVLRNDGILQGLEPEDTIVHFDTVDGHKTVQPSNKVYVYAPRFGSVRKVEGVITNQRKELATAAGSNTKLVQQHGFAATQLKAQEQSAIYTRSKDQLESANGRDRGVQAAGRRFLLENSTSDTAMDFSILAKNEWVSSKELPFVAQAKNNAICWSGKQNVLIRVNELTLREMHGIDKAQSVFVIDDDNKVTEIRLIKLASTGDALPGETIDFAIRFENTGREPVKNVTILDSLTTRLEFLPNTAKSSLPASFHVEENEVGSMILRWQMNGEMQPGQSGVVVFKCRVK